MKKIHLLFLLLFFSFANSQSILSALNYNKKYDVKQSKSIYKIVNTLLFYDGYGVQESSEVTYLNSNFRVLKEERFNSEGELKYSTEIKYKNDSIKIGRNTTTKIPLLGNQIEYITYDLDSDNFLVTIIKKKKRSQILETVNLKNDEFGNPIFLKLNDGEFGYEKANYDYQNNTVTVFYYNSKDELITSSTAKINYSKVQNNDEYNEQGNLVKSSNNLFEYKYDKYGNWVKQIRYNVRGNSKTKEAVFTRKIYYK